MKQLVEDHGVVLQRHGQDFIGLCPFHNDKEPSLVVSPKKNLWNCLGACQAGGSVIDWVMRARGVSFRNAVEILRDSPFSLAAKAAVAADSREISWAARDDDNEDNEFGDVTLLDGIVVDVVILSESSKPHPAAGARLIGVPPWPVFSITSIFGALSVLFGVPVFRRLHWEGKGAQEKPSCSVKLTSTGMLLGNLEGNPDLNIAACEST